MPTDRDVIRDRIEAAFRRLPPKGHTVDEKRLRRGADLLSYMAVANSKAGRMPAMFRDVARTTCVKEIEAVNRHATKIAELAAVPNGTDDIAELATTLAGHISKLHQPTILALADAGFLRLSVLDAVDSIKAAAEITGEQRQAILDASRKAAQCSKRAKVARIAGTQQKKAHLPTI